MMTYVYYVMAFKPYPQDHNSETLEKFWSQLASDDTVSFFHQGAKIITCYASVALLKTSEVNAHGCFEIHVDDNFLGKTIATNGDVCACKGINKQWIVGYTDFSTGTTILRERSIDLTHKPGVGVVG